MAISGLIITFNEERNIGQCIDALYKLCEEVIVIDSYSIDKTVDIAKEKGAIVYSQKFLGDGPQRIHGLQYCKNDWILNLDADEILDTDAYEFIKSDAYLKNDYDAYNFRVKNHLGTKLIDFACWYPDYTCRFFNKISAKPSISKVHQRIQANNIKNTNLHFLHYGWSSFFQIISKKNQYTDWQAKQLFTEGKRVSALSPITHGLASFIKCYFIKKGIFNGLDGLTFSLIQMFFSYMKYAKLLKLYRNK